MKHLLLFIKIMLFNPFADYSIYFFIIYFTVYICGWILTWRFFLYKIVAYWGRDSTAAAAAAAASNQLFGSHFGAAAAGLGLLPGAGAASANDRYSMNNHHQNTMAVAASQAASLAGLHPASKFK